jgi:hypothetical protein
MEAEMHALSSNNKEGTSEKQFREVILFLFYRLFELLLLGFIPSWVHHLRFLHYLFSPVSISSISVFHNGLSNVLFIHLCVSSFFLHFVPVFVPFLVSPTHILLENSSSFLRSAFVRFTSVPTSGMQCLVRPTQCYDVHPRRYNTTKPPL